MREILFRAKRLEDGKWVEGYIVPYAVNTYEEGVEIISTDGINYDELDGSFPSYISDSVCLETVGQFTGLTDKNGVKIFEGDILCCENTRGIIKFRNGLFIFRWKKVDKYRPDYFKDCILNQYSRFSEVEVIGNIFDNPELMEGGEQ